MTEREHTPRGRVEAGAGPVPQWADRYAVAALLEALEVPDRWRDALALAVLEDERAVAVARGLAAVRETVRRLVVDLESTPVGPDLVDEVEPS